MPTASHRLDQMRTKRVLNTLYDHQFDSYFEAETLHQGGHPVTIVRRRGPSDLWTDHIHAWLKDTLSVIPGVETVRADSTQAATVVWRVNAE